MVGKIRAGARIERSVGVERCRWKKRCSENEKPWRLGRWAILDVRWDLLTRCWSSAGESPENYLAQQAKVWTVPQECVRDSTFAFPWPTKVAIVLQEGQL